MSVKVDGLTPPPVYGQVDPGYNLWDRFAGFFGDHSYMDNKAAKANYQSSLNYLHDQTYYKMRGLLDNGINPLIAAQQGFFNTSPMTQGSNVSGKSMEAGGKEFIKLLKSLIFGMIFF